MLSKKTTNETNLDKIIKELEEHILATEVDTEDYDHKLKQLDMLCKLRNGDKPSRTELRDWIPVIGSISSVLIIVMFEASGHTLLSKSLGFVTKLRA